jgi:hypothetical protein
MTCTIPSLCNTALQMKRISRNQGEEKEVFLKAFLLEKMRTGERVQPFGRISSLSFGPNLPVPEWKPQYSQFLEKNNYNKLKKIFAKAPSSYKADIEVNGKSYSLKSKGAARAAIINHTSRAGFVRVCSVLNVDIAPLDRIIKQYWKKRESGVITEDICNTHLESPFRNHREYLGQIIKYFLFTGTGGKDSAFPADCVLEFKDPKDPDTFKVLTKETVLDHIWDDLVFSVRSKKGMPASYDATTHAVIAPWVKLRPGDVHPKGALHVRT